MGTDVHDLRWKIGWSPLIVVGAIWLVFTVIGVNVDRIVPFAVLGFVLGGGLWIWGVSEINDSYRSVLGGFVDGVEQTAKRAIEADEGSLYSLTYGSGSSPPLIEPTPEYVTTAIVITDSSITLNKGARLDMQSRSGVSGGRNAELYFDQVTGVESSHGNQVQLEISTAGGEAIRIRSNDTETVEAVVSELRKRIRRSKRGPQASASRNSPPSETRAPAQSNATSTGPSGANESNVQANARPETRDSSDAGEQTDGAKIQAPIQAAAERAADTSELETAVTGELCAALQQSEPDPHRVLDALSAVIERIETTAEVTDTLESVTEPGRGQTVDSATDELAGRSDPVATAVTPLLERVNRTQSELAEHETTSEALVSSARTICRHAQQSGVMSFSSTSATERRLESVAQAVEDGTISMTASVAEVEPVATRVRRETGPDSQVGQELLTALQEPATHDLGDVLTASVESLDRYTTLERSLADIGHADVRRRLDSLDDELHSTDGAIYRHLADRIREFETTLDEVDQTDPVQLYAIYNECTYYDRTLLPRLSRESVETTGPSLDGRIGDVDERIAALEAEYIDVRADHNHSIPRHFLSLATELRDRADDCRSQHPERANGLLLATADVMQHVEALYERNEFSVMLRRLRG